MPKKHNFWGCFLPTPSLSNQNSHKINNEKGREGQRHREIREAAGKESECAAHPGALYNLFSWCILFPFCSFSIKMQLQPAVLLGKPQMDFWDTLGGGSSHSDLCNIGTWNQAKKWCFWIATNVLFGAVWRKNSIQWLNCRQDYKASDTSWAPDAKHILWDKIVLASWWQNKCGGYGQSLPELK